MKGEWLIMKIINFLKDNKEEMKVIAYGVTMMSLGIHIGVRAERQGMDRTVTKLADTGKRAYKIINNEIYQMEIIKGLPK